jgi:hypothetical protein
MLPIGDIRRCATGTCTAPPLPDTRHCLQHLLAAVLPNPDVPRCPAPGCDHLRLWWDCAGMFGPSCWTHSDDYGGVCGPDEDGTHLHADWCVDHNEPEQTPWWMSKGPTDCDGADDEPEPEPEPGPAHEPEPEPEPLTGVRRCPELHCGRIADPGSRLCWVHT